MSYVRWKCQKIKDRENEYDIKISNENIFEFNLINIYKLNIFT